MDYQSRGRWHSAKKEVKMNCVSGCPYIMQQTNEPFSWISAFGLDSCTTVSKADDDRVNGDFSANSFLCCSENTTETVWFMAPANRNTCGAGINCECKSFQFLLFREKMTKKCSEAQFGVIKTAGWSWNHLYRVVQQNSTCQEAESKFYPGIL
jgi:hypothetical protein